MSMTVSIGLCLCAIVYVYETQYTTTNIIWQLVVACCSFCSTSCRKYVLRHALTCRTFVEGVVRSVRAVVSVLWPMQSGMLLRCDIEILCLCVHFFERVRSCCSCNWTKTRKGYENADVTKTLSTGVYNVSNITAVNCMCGECLYFCLWNVCGLYCHEIKMSDAFHPAEICSYFMSNQMCPVESFRLQIRVSVSGSVLMIGLCLLHKTHPHTDALHTLWAHVMLVDMGGSGTSTIHSLRSVNNAIYHQIMCERVCT